MSNINILCSQNCKNAGNTYENYKSFHDCNKKDISLSNLEKRSGCKYCPYLERATTRKQKKN